MQLEGDGRDLFAACSIHCHHILSFPFSLLLQGPPCPVE